jgi:hypothetical protein
MTQHRTEGELRKIALDMAKGLIFSDWQVERDEDVSLVFQAINLMSEVQLLELQTRDIGMIFEYKTAAAYQHEEIPIFVSFSTLTKEEAIKVGEMYTHYYTLIHESKEVEI